MVGSMALVLGIETSCDETSLSLLKGEGERAELIDTLTYSQIEIYKEWGGVVPEIASRNHLKKLQPLFEEILTKNKIQSKDIDLIGVTCFPGLLGPLLTGINLAKSLALFHKKPIYPANHLLAHLEAIHLTKSVSYPYLGILLSGGHSLFVKVTSENEMEVLASTIDDAAGEAFDKGGKLMGAPYPSGPWIDKQAKEGDKKKYSFPIGLIKEPENPNMSFSGLKTSLRLMIEKDDSVLLPENIKDLCASYQETIVQGIAKKFSLIKAKFPTLPVVVGGGVACNSRLREVLKEKYKDIGIVEPRYCTDNASMIANLAYRNRSNAFPFPECLDIDAKSRFINKKNFIKS